MNREPKVAFGEAVRRYRGALQLSQEKLAEAAGMDRTYVSGVERGRRNPTLTSIWRLAEALGVRPAELLAAADSILISDPGD